MSDDELETPESNGNDAVHSVVKAGLSALPIVGGPAAELFQNVIQPPLEKRRSKWMNQVGEKLSKLERNGFNLESLRDNPEFISAVLYASNLALRTHNESKLIALRNAIANIAQGQAPNETLQHIFLNMVDTLTELHVRILKAFQAPEVPQNMSMGELGRVLEHNLPDMRGQQALYQQMWKELFSRGLVVGDNMNIALSGSGLAQKQTTSLGDDFLNFISDL